MSCTVPNRVLPGDTPKPAFLSGLPPFPQVALRAMQLLSHEDSETKTVVEVISSDTAFTAEMLRIANSPLYGMSQEIKILRHAAVILGRDRLRSLTMTVAMQSYLKAPFRAAPYQNCWRHSLATGLLAGGFASLCEMSQEEAYTAGLLHDVGRYALLLSFGKKYMDLMSTPIAGDQLLAEEQKLFGVDHCQAGWWLLVDWGLPNELASAAAFHHEEPPEESVEAADLAALACRTATLLGFEAQQTSGLWTFEDTVRRLRGQQEEAARLDVDLLRESIETKIGTLCA